MSGQNGTSLTAGEALRIEMGRRFRCGTIRDVVLVFMLQKLCTDRSGNETPLDQYQRDFHSQALTHLGIVTGPKGPPRCNCRVIHEAVEKYCREWESRSLKDEERVISISPAALTIEWFNELVAVIKARRPMRQQSAATN